MKGTNHPTTGDPSGSNSNDQSYTYDDLGEKMKTVFDENGAIRAFTYDVLGRTTSDGFALTGSGEDATVRSMGYTYDTNGQLSTASSYSGYLNTGTLLNQVEEDYNGLGQLIGEYQSHSGAVNTSTTLEVKYLYAGLTGSTSDGRATGMIYPTTSTDTTPRQLNYVYNTGLDSNISRISALADQSGDGAGNVESYSYLGLSTIVQRNRPNGVNLTYAKLSGESNGSAGDEYTGLDEFGRVIDQRWTTSTGTNVERYQYAYDADSNLMYKYNLSTGTNAGNFSELYHTNTSGSGYDALNRLIDFQRGLLDPNAQTMTVSGTAGISQDWTLDAVGNWSSFSTNGTPQSRTANQRNEYTAVGSNTPTYDNNGNLTKDENGQQYVYDAWNRLKQVKNSSGTVLVTYNYDALGRRIVEAVNGGNTTDLYFDTTGHVIEERQGSTVTRQYVWGLGAPDQLVLRDDNIAGTHNYGRTSGGLTERIFVQQDVNQNVTGLVSTSGTVLERFAYDPYGKQYVEDANWSPTSEAYQWLYTFQAGRKDATSGLLHFGTPGRDYSTSLGRWTEPDGGYWDGSNLYQADDSAPTTMVDPSGGHAFAGGGFGSIPIRVVQPPREIEGGGDPGSGDSGVGNVAPAPPLRPPYYGPPLGTMVPFDTAGAPTTQPVLKPSPLPGNRPPVATTQQSRSGCTVPKGTPKVHETRGNGEADYAIMEMQLHDGSWVTVYVNLNGDPDFNYDCNGHCFGSDKVWIDDAQVPQILDSGYSSVNSPAVGDIAVYYDGNGQVVHSARVDRVRNGIVFVTSKNGSNHMRADVHADRCWPPGAAQKDSIPPTYFRPPAPTTQPTTQPSK